MSIIILVFWYEKCPKPILPVCLCNTLPRQVIKEKTSFFYKQANYIHQLEWIKLTSWIEVHIITEKCAGNVIEISPDASKSSVPIINIHIVVLLKGVEKCIFLNFSHEKWLKYSVSKSPKCRLQHLGLIQRYRSISTYMKLPGKAHPRGILIV